MELVFIGLIVVMALITKLVARLPGRYMLPWWRAFAFSVSVTLLWLILWSPIFKPAHTEVLAVMVLLALNASAGALLLANRDDEQPKYAIDRGIGAVLGTVTGLVACVAPYLFLINIDFPRIG